MSQLCKKEPFLLSSFGHRVCTCVCGHWCALVLCCVTYPPLPTHTHTHRSLQRSLHPLSFPCEVLQVPQPLRSNLRKHFLCIGLHYEHFTNMNLLSSHKILKGRYYYHPHFTDEDSETKRGEVTCANSHGRSHNSKCHFGSGTHTLIDIINLRS